MNLKMRDFLAISDGILRFMGKIHDSGTMALLNRAPYATKAFVEPMIRGFSFG